MENQWNITSELTKTFTQVLSFRVPNPPEWMSTFKNALRHAKRKFSCPKLNLTNPS